MEATADELFSVFTKFGETTISEIEFWHLEPEVLDFHKDQFKDSTELRYISDRIMLIGPNLGLVTTEVKAMLNDLDSRVKKFRKLYLPFNYQYTITNTGNTIKVSSSAHEA